MVLQRPHDGDFTENACVSMYSVVQNFVQYVKFKLASQGTWCQHWCLIRIHVLILVLRLDSVTKQLFRNADVDVKLVKHSNPI